MFGLPSGTLWLVLGVPLFWIGYLAVFMVITRNWADDDAAGDDSS
jgi:hypothetical protein